MTDPFGAEPDPRGLDVERLRTLFPALQREEAGLPVQYFDNPAGTQVPRGVIAGIARYLEQGTANTHGDFATSRRTDEMIGEARRLSAAFVGGDDVREIAFGPNMTTLTQSVSRALARSLSPGDELVVSDLDHDANVTPWVDLEQAGMVVRRIPVRREDCSLDLERFREVLSPRTRWVAVGYASNAVGTINDLRRIIDLSHEVGARVWVDAVHYAPHGPIDVQQLNADFLVCSAYKFFGPHLGILWGRRQLLEELPIHQLRPAPSTAPEKLETGTKNHECLAGLVETYAYLADLGGGDLAGDARAALVAGMQRIRGYELDLGRYLLAGLESVPGLRLYGSTEPDTRERVPTFGFTLAGVPSADVSRRLARRGIYCWVGNHYALTLLERLGLEGSGGLVRVGAVHYNTFAEVDRLVEELGEIVRLSRADP